MPVPQIDEDGITELKKAAEIAGPLDFLRLTYAEYREFLHTLAWLMGGPIDSVNAFVTGVPDPDSGKHRVYWLRGRPLGEMTVGQHQGAQGEDGDVNLDATVRPIAGARLELQDAGIQWDPGDVAPDVRPTVKIFFADGHEIRLSVRGRPNQPARDQAGTFLAQLQTNLAAVA